MIELADVAMRSPGDGLPPYRLPDLVGRVLKRDVDEDEALNDDMLEEA